MAFGGLSQGVRVAQEQQVTVNIMHKDELSRIFARTHGEIHKEVSVKWKMPDPQLFNDPTGKTSMSRFLYFAVVMTVMGVWAYISILANAMVIIDPGLIGVILIMAGQKTSQAWPETRLIKPPPFVETDITTLAERKKQ